MDDVEIAEESGIGDALAEPFDDFPTFDDEQLHVDATAGVKDAQLHLRSATKRLYIDYRAHPDAIHTLSRIPAEGQSLHAVMSEKHSMWDLVPALIQRTGKRITELHIATLSYSAQTSAELVGLLDDGRIKRVSLVVSAYFLAQNKSLCDGLVGPLAERGHRVLVMRNHAKLMLVKLAGGGSFVCEGSANLRSCGNVEQFVLTRCRKLYRFHRDWMERELLSRCKGASDAN